MSYRLACVAWCTAAMQFCREKKYASRAVRCVAPQQLVYSRRRESYIYIPNGVIKLLLFPPCTTYLPLSYIFTRVPIFCLRRWKKGVVYKKKTPPPSSHPARRSPPTRTSRHYYLIYIILLRLQTCHRLGDGGWTLRETYIAAEGVLQLHRDCIITQQQQLYLLCAASSR